MLNKERDKSRSRNPFRPILGLFSSEYWLSSSQSTLHKSLFIKSTRPSIQFACDITQIHRMEIPLIGSQIKFIHIHSFCIQNFALSKKVCVLQFHSLWLCGLIVNHVNVLLKDICRSISDMHKAYISFPRSVCVDSINRRLVSTRKRHDT